MGDHSPLGQLCASEFLQDYSIIVVLIVVLDGVVVVVCVCLHILLSPLSVTGMCVCLVLITSDWRTYQSTGPQRKLVLPLHLVLRSCESSPSTFASPLLVLLCHSF